MSRYYTTIHTIALLMLYEKAQMSLEKQVSPYIAKKASIIFKSPSAIRPTNTALEVEAQAMLMEVQQQRTLGFKQVVFLSDCKMLIDELNRFNTEMTIEGVRNT